MKRPNFFIMGAPKCGTTSLAGWLAKHDNIFISNPKEVHFFNADSDHHSIFSLDDYENIFKEANELHYAVGEASVWYLVSEDATDNILKYQSNAKFIVCLRNPVEMSVSLHDQKKYSGDEPIADFIDAWNAQDERMNGLNIPQTCMDINHLLYGESCKVGKQLTRLIHKAGREKVLIILMDDMKSDPRKIYLEVLNFLGVNDDGRMEFPVVNVAKQRKVQWLRLLMRKWGLFKQKLGIKSGTGFGALLDKLNRVERKRAPLDEDMCKELKNYFADDIDVLSALLKRDLSHWYK